MHLVIVHIGPEFPDMITECVRQFRVFNKDTPVHILTEHEWPGCTKVPKTQLHKDFNALSRLDRESLNGFWHVTAERFMVIYDFMKHTGFTDVLHIEYDNLVYTSVEKLGPVFTKHYRHIGAVTDCPQRVVPGIMYFRDVEATEHLALFMKDHVKNGSPDFTLLKMYMNSFPERMKALPIARPPYVPSEYTNHWDEFQCVFDAAALGQYIGGVDPRNIPGNTEGFVNESCIFRADRAGIEWRDGRPWAFGMPIVNLHIHSKNLKKWSTHS
jgi:hypothetical protein